MKWTIEYVPHGNYFKVVNEGPYKTGNCVKLFESIFLSDTGSAGNFRC